MSELKPAYKQALRDACDAFEEKYGAAIEAALIDVRDVYGIEAETRLAHILEVSMRKFILGLDQKLGVYTAWFNTCSADSPEISQGFEKTYPTYAKGVQWIVDQAVPSPELEALLSLDIGRSRVTLRTHQLIQENQGDIGKKPFGDASYDVLGSVIKRAIMSYYAQNGHAIKVGVDPTFKSAIPMLSRLRDRLSVEAEPKDTPALLS